MMYISGLWIGFIANDNQELASTSSCELHAMRATASSKCCWALLHGLRLVLVSMTPCATITANKHPNGKEVPLCIV